MRGAREAARASGSVPVRACEKLRELVDGRDGELCYAVEGFVDERGRPGLHLHVSAELRVGCRRCLGPMTVRLDSRRDIVMAAGVSEFEQDEEDDDDTDVVPLVPRLDLSALAEEEAVLSMPLAPCHADGECEPAVGAAWNGEPAVKPSPFAALARLKRS